MSIFCPPAGAVAGVALAAADMYSAASGKDWMTGRELDDGERLMRGAFALFDLVPGVGYLNDLAKTGKVAGLAGIKASLKTSFKEGMEQAAKNMDNFKVVLRNMDDFRKQLITKVDDFGKQLDNLVNRTVISGAEELSAVLRTADNVLSEAAQNFRLNIGLEPQLIDGFMPTPPPGKLSGLADNIQAFAKNLDGSVDEVVESGANSARTQSIEIRLKKFSEGTLKFEDVLDDYSKAYADLINDNSTWSWRQDVLGGDILTPRQKSQIKQHAIETGLIKKIEVRKVEGMRYGFADFRGAGVVYETKPLPKELWLATDEKQFDYLNELIGGPKPGMTWHHSEIPGQMELVPFGIHNIVPHNGGRSPGMWAFAPR